MKRDSIGYPLNQCALYKIKSKRQLADKLLIGENSLIGLCDGKDRYSCWAEEKKNGGLRTIEAPFENLKAVQKRIAVLLQRVEPPSYLMAPVKGRSYVDNAARHVGARAFRLLDLENFFPSCTEKRVFWFFRQIMLCEPDVAGILASLSTRHGHLPQGSPCSPILAFFSYLDMWEEIRAIVEASGCRLSVYADDITISGETVYERDIWKIKKVLHRFGHKYSRRKERRLFGKAADVTGVIVTSELLLPNRQHKQLTVVRRARDEAQARDEKLKLERQLRGRLAQAAQIARHRQKISNP